MRRAEQYVKKLWDWKGGKKRSPQSMGMGGAESRVRVKGRGMKGGESEWKEVRL